MPEIDELPGDVLAAVCGFCGVAIYSMEIAADFEGRMVDYDARDGMQPCAFALCGECRNRVKEVLKMIASGDITPAVERRNQINQYD